VETLYLAFSLAALVALVSYIWLVVVAFKKSVGWGFAVMLLSPITAIIFAIKNWRKSKKPFLIYITTSTACYAYIGYIFVYLGGLEMMDMAQRMQQGKFSEQEAVQFMEKTMDRMATSGMLGAQEKKELQEIQGMFQQMKKGTADAKKEEAPPLAKASAGKVGVTPEKEAEVRVASAEPTAPAYKPIAVAEAGKYVGANIKVVGKDGVVHKGILKEVNPDRLVLETWVYDGTFGFELRSTDIESLQVYR
jgi:hypothetical protein